MMKWWMLPVILWFLVLGGCIKDGTDRDSTTRVLNEMNQPTGGPPTIGVALSSPTDRDARIAELQAALAAERDKVAKLQKDLKSMGVRGKRVTELEQRLREQDEELARLSQVKEQMDNIRSRINILQAARQECEEQLSHIGINRPTLSMVKMQQDLLVSLQPEIKRGGITVSQAHELVTINLAAAALFASGSDQLLTGGVDILKRVGSVLKTFPDKTVTVTGHTDSRRIMPSLQKRFSSNKELSDARAENGAKILKQAGVDPKTVRTVGKGESQPIATNATDEGRARNRRIEIVVKEG